VVWLTQVGVVKDPFIGIDFSALTPSFLGINLHDCKKTSKAKANMRTCIQIISSKIQKTEPVSLPHEKL
jgi:hypothetical protein